MTSSLRSSRESFLEKKITLLDRRLTLLEKFVETKFGEKHGFQNQNAWKTLIDDGTRNKARASTHAATKSSPKYDPRRRHPAPVDDDEDEGDTGNNHNFDGSTSNAPGFRTPTPSRSSEANTQVGSDNCRKEGVKVVGRSSRSRADPAVPLSVKRKLTGTGKGLSPSTSSGDRHEEGLQGGGISSRRRYNTRSKGKSIEIENLEDEDERCSNVEEEEETTTSIPIPVELDLAKNENENCDDHDVRSEGHYYPGGQDEMDETAENYDDEDGGLLPGTQPESEDEEPANSGLEYGTSDEDSDEAYKPHKKRAKSSTGTAAKTRTRTKRKSKAKGQGEESPAKQRVYAPADLVSIARDERTRKQCPECHKYIKLDWFHKHVNAHFRERNLKCQHCDKTFFCLSSLQKHTQLHKPEIYSTKCRICQKSLPRIDKALAHERICVTKTLERKEHVVPEIIEDIKRRSHNWTLKVPSESDADADPNELKECPHCQKLYKAPFLPKHIRTHTETQEWACSLCDKAYFHKSGLQRHFASTHQLPTCELCSKTFPDRKDLIPHVLECRKKQQNDSLGENRSASSEGHQNQLDADLEDQGQGEGSCE